MLSLKVTPLAQHDLKEIGRYTQNRWGKYQRNKYLKEIDQQFNKIAKNPSTGQCRNDLFENCQSIIIKSHIIFYRKMESKIEILRVLHQSMDINNKKFF